MDAAYSIPVPEPWEMEGALTRHLMTETGPNGKSKFHKIDPWHMLHLGAGKSWAASGILLLQSLVGESTADKRIQALSNDYREFCRRERLTPFIQKFDIHTLGGGGSSEPVGGWSKASVTSNMLLWLEDFCARKHEQVRSCEQLRIFVSGLHVKMHVRYTSD